MSTFKTSLKAVTAHRLYILIYLVALSLFDLLAGATQAGSSSDQVRQATISIAVIDCDGFTISHGVRDYVESVGKARPLEDPRQAIQDAAVQNRINYVLIVPTGYGQRLQEATHQGTGPSRMDTAVGYESATGSLTNVCTDSYLGQVADYLSTLTEDSARTVSLAGSTMNRSAPAERVAQDAVPLLYGLIAYAKLSIYSTMALTTVTISTPMVSLGRQVVRSRLTATPVNNRSRNLGIMSACLVIGLIGWLWVFGLAVAALGASAVTAPVPLLGIIGAALDAYMLAVTSLRSLMGRSGLNQSVANAVANIGDTALSFLAGTWVSIKWMPDAVVQATRLMPSHQAAQTISGAFTATSMSADVIGLLLANCGICTLFVITTFVVAMAVGRTRARSPL